MADKEKFMGFLRRRGFKVSNNFFARCDLIPHHYKTDDGDHVLISNMTIVNFDGSDTVEGELGCVSMYFGGVKRRKHCRHVFQDEILKKAFCPNSLEEAKRVYKEWAARSNEAIESWQKIL